MESEQTYWKTQPLRFPNSLLFRLYKPNRARHDWHPRIQRQIPRGMF